MELLAPALLAVAAAGALFQTEPAESPRPLRIAVVGLVHQHAEGLLWHASRRDDLELVGVCEPDVELFERLAGRYGLAPELRFDALEPMLDAVRPEAVSVMTSIAAHLETIEACAPRGVHALVEKPLAFELAAARRMAALAEEHRVHVLTNFETSWYASIREAKRRLRGGELGSLRRMVFRHGHRGPIEIGCYPEFTDWLCDPDANGGGALVDFGCYGAVLATWLMGGERPTTIRASASTLKPERYPEVDDDATIVLSYPTATAVIQASWCWTHDCKELDLHLEGRSLHAGKWSALEQRAPDQPAVALEPAPMPAHLADEWTYLRRVIRGECAVDPLSSLDLNVTVAAILDEARRQVARAE